MKVLCVFGKYQYGVEARGVSIEYRSFVPALERNGHQVQLFDSWDKRAHADLADLNRALLDTVEAERPDVMLFVPMLGEVWLETLRVIRDRGDVTTVCWTTDDSWKYRQQSRYLGPAFHAITTTYPEMVKQYHADGIAHVLATQWAASAEDLREPLPAAECRHQVTFVGAMHGNRQERVAELAAAGIEVACFGYGWPNGAVSGTEMIEIIRSSVISLNFANSQGTNQIKARVFEVPGAGGFMLTEDAPGLSLHYEIGSEIDSFRSMDELIRKIRYYLDHPSVRDEMARRSFARTREQHTYDRRMEEVLRFAAERKRQWAANGRTGDPVPISEAFERHQVGPLLRAFRAGLVHATTLIWGAEKGRRAARRLVYELSWRLSGARTYSASGLVGRMFPRD